MFRWLLKILTDKAIIAAILGGIISAIVQKRKLAYSVFSVLAGGVTAYYLTPLVLQIRNLDDSLYASVAFVIGVAAIGIIKQIVKKTNKWLEQKK